jgi:hypothetical protein
MSFIDDSIKNVKRQLIKEVSGGGVAGFVGGKGMGIDALFAGPYHPDSGHGSQNRQLLDKQLKDRRQKRKDLESDRDGVIDDYSGLADPVGGYYESDTEVARLAYEELELKNQLALEFNIENTPEQDLEWVEVETDLEYDDAGEAYKIKDIVYDDNSSLYNRVKDIVYDDKPTYAGNDFINKSTTNWKYINRGDK